MSSSGGGGAERKPRVVLGVCGGIAAYKAVEVCRRLVDAGVHVTPVLTDAATRFVTPLTFSALASEPAQTELFDGPEPIPHTRLGQQADLVLVAPATARLIGAYAAGLSSDLLSATLLATRAPVLVAPAMHTEMWEHPAVQENLATLRRRGVHVVEPESGHLAGGDVGAGRLAAPDVIAEAALDLLGRSRELTGVTVLVTAGGTREPIDPVRFVGNRSSGKMGHAVAHEAAKRGARVTLVTTASVGIPQGVEVVSVETAQQMADAVLGLAPHVSAVVMAAAVADFRPRTVAGSKLKKADGVPELVLERTPDILAALGAAKPAGQVLVGFAAETDEVCANAAAKLEAKHVDLMVANDVTAPGAGFEVDTNCAVLLDSLGRVDELPLMTKTALAGVILDRIAITLRAVDSRIGSGINKEHQ
ncbi:MAG: phosphopantothenoylcysteine decarboxylase / phosphopantothenate---cysteine ligase [Actinomycetota bacterium]|jgi:phosphopantothenoylcysteine decarboxylase/phosphopantothenate--cysteine ligase|nr:phosphopantothenoylcysteine decarboxylase / phosphopantothenate---cysteine ligase [Actinomycetota bacterium]